MKAIDAAEVKRMMVREPHPTLINTLSEESFEQTHIPGAINIPQEHDDFVQRVEQTAGGRDQPVIVYCASQDCDSSTEGAQKLENAGFAQVYDFEAGAKGWQEAGEELEAATR